MSATSQLAQIIRVKLSRDDRGVWTATSPTLKGLIVVSKNEDLLVSQLIPDAIVELYAACGQRVVIARAQRETEELLPWVVVPAALAKDGVERAYQN
jgi:hypothetical protein